MKYKSEFSGHTLLPRTRVGTFIFGRSGRDKECFHYKHVLGPLVQYWDLRTELESLSSLNTFILVVEYCTLNSQSYS
ncbi:hypothetical protein Mapa_001578 [Marchantia paleacea]|nr:hypothetical protein Mapa_001578 [Marchantia paleacea]